jgi:hypothetical protein
MQGVFHVPGSLLNPDAHTFTERQVKAYSVTTVRKPHNFINMTSTSIHRVPAVRFTSRVSTTVALFGNRIMCERAIVLPL